MLGTQRDFGRTDFDVALECFDNFQVTITVYQVFIRKGSFNGFVDDDRSRQVVEDAAEFDGFGRGPN